MEYSVGRYNVYCTTPRNCSQWSNPGSATALIDAQVEFTPTCTTVHVYRKWNHPVEFNLKNSLRKMLLKIPFFYKEDSYSYFLPRTEKSVKSDSDPAWWQIKNYFMLLLAPVCYFWRQENVSGRLP